jgi:ABC-type uncharacterized transport system ATPase subunit
VNPVPAEPTGSSPVKGLVPPALELRGIDKRFGAVHANRAVSLAVARGTVHGLVGENGAGKSTLMNIVYGFHRADAGEIWIHGRRVDIHRPHDAIAAGIGMVHQHFMLVENFTVLENVILGVEGGRRLLADGLDPGARRTRRTRPRPTAWTCRSIPRSGNCRSGCSSAWRS